MNNRIKELAEQAHRYANNAVKETNLFVLDVFKEKFAELIVRECSKIAFQNDIAKLTRDGMKIGFQIEQHFGVKE